MTEITIRRPDDMHLHLRDGAMLEGVLPETTRHFARAVIMPNLVPPVVTFADARAYHGRILAALPQGSAFEPLMTLYLTEGTDPADVAAAAASGLVKAVKLYPAGATTNSHSGVADFSKVQAVLEKMAEIALPLCLHGEVTDPAVDIFDREAVFIDRILAPLRARVPGLRVVMEHITTEQGVTYAREGGADLAATITTHHLILNRNHILVGGIRPHYYCLPVAKREHHRLALIAAATSGDQRFFLGTDSAPHVDALKEHACGCAGCFTASNTMPLLAHVFEDCGALDKLEAFTSQNGAAFYRLPLNTGTLTLTKQDAAQTWPDKIGTRAGPVTVFDPGFPVHWQAQAIAADDKPSLLSRAQALYDKLDDPQLCDLVVSADPADFALLLPALVDSAFGAACDAGNIDAALHIFGQQSALGPRAALPQRLISLMHQNGQTEAAMDLILAWRPENATAAHAMQRASALERLNAVAAAQAELDQASQRFPKAFNPAIQKAKLDLKVNDRAAAIASLTLALARSDDKQLWMRRTLNSLLTEHITLRGIDLWVPAEVVSPSLISRMAQDQYEAGECGAIVQDLRPGDRILDLGAGLGLVSLVANRACPGVACAVVEADPRLIPVLQRNLTAHGCTATVHHGLAGLQDGTAAFHLATEFWASSRQSTATDIGTVQVPDLDMTRIMAETAPTILVMDVEGAEADLLPVLDLSNLRRVVVELHPEVYGPTQQYTLVAQMLAQGFELSEQPVWARVFSFSRTAPILPQVAP